MECEICGKKTEKLFEVVIDGEVYKACKECARFGKIRKEKEIHFKDYKPKEVVKEIKEIEEIISPEAPKLIRELRQKEGLTRSEFARKYNISEKIIEKLEKGQHVDINIVKRIEKILKIPLIEKVEIYYNDKEKRKIEKREETLTVGDILIIRD
ncbi:MAG: helix-turn-helix domain-containing protein [Nanoarchaeota archaeon]